MGTGLGCLAAGALFLHSSEGLILISCCVYTLVMCADINVVLSLLVLNVPSPAVFISVDSFIRSCLQKRRGLNSSLLP